MMFDAGKILKGRENASTQSMERYPSNFHKPDDDLSPMQAVATTQLDSTNFPLEDLSLLPL